MPFSLYRKTPEYYIKGGGGRGGSDLGIIANNVDNYFAE
jgi:hypothetical protein